MAVFGDPGEVIGYGCWETIKRVLVMCSTMWVGFFLALFALAVSEIVGAMWLGAWTDIDEMMLEVGQSLLFGLVLAPFYYLFSYWGFVCLPVLAVIFFFMFREDRDVMWFWYATVSLLGLVAILSGIDFSLGYAIDVVTWVAFGLELLSLAAGCWFLSGWNKNRHAQHLMDIHLQNEFRKSEIEKTYGTKSFGQDHHVDSSDT